MEGKIRMSLASLVLGVMLAFCGCGDDVKVIEGEVKNAAEGNNASVENAAESGNASAKGNTKAGEGEAESAAAGQKATYKGYVFIYNDVIVEMDAEAAPILEALGEARSYFEAASCAFEGLDKMYTYNSFEVDTYPMQEADYISAVIFKDDAVTTAEGIGIGDSKDKVEAVYGNGGKEEDGMLVYEKDGVTLSFIFQDENVVSVEYHSTVLDE